MKFQLALPLIASVASVANAQTAAYLNAIISDIQAHRSEYLSYIGAGNLPPSGVLQVYQQVSTYTDDSYTTLYNQIDLSAVSTFATALPWYSTRLQSEIEAAVAAETGSGESSSAAESSAAESSAAASSTAESSAAESSAAASTSESSSEAASSAAGSSETSESSSAAVSTQSGSNAANGYGQGSGIVWLVGPAMLALGVPLLL